jgi:hypothetical protein
MSTAYMDRRDIAGVISIIHIHIQRVHSKETELPQLGKKRSSCSRAPMMLTLFTKLVLKWRTGQLFITQATNSKAEP